MLLNCGVGEDSWKSLGQQADPTTPSWRKSVLNIHWKDWCWRWNSNTLATWCEELTHWKRPWGWLKIEGGRRRGWRRMRWLDGITWTWVWVNSGSWWWTGRPGMLRSMGLQRVGHNWTTELNWTKLVVQWVTSCLPMQEMQLQSLGGQLSSQATTSKPSCHN